MASALWKVAGKTLDLTDRALIMGVLNVTPDSFSDGGKFADTESALNHGLQMAGEGAQIIDVGGESTRPGAEAVSEAEELQRVVPVITRLCALSDAMISIDTSKAAVARTALDAGASIINDITGGRGDEEMLWLAAERGCGFIIMHMQGTPRTMQKAPHYDDVVTEVANFFRQQYARAVECGIEPMAIAFDPGIGFGKTLEHNLELLRNLPRLRIDNRPLVVGVSRKSFLGKMIGAPEMSHRTTPTIAFTTLLRERGANVIRVHDVKPNADALRTTEAFLATAK
ncbi:MAG: dihydropteroate synthase [Chthoniobacterales bacterium]|nr:dihydropteroate synthase [Chthoniobacterales bacterium]